MDCPNCDQPIASDSKFCIHCGYKIEKKAKKESKSDNNAENETFNKVLDHLEFLGYEIGEKTFKDEWYSCLCKHSSKSNIFIRFHTTIGFTLSARYLFSKDKVIKKKKEFLELINKMNNSSLLTCFALSESAEDIACYCWYPASYSKQTFGSLIELFEGDIKRGLASINIEDFT